MVASCLDNKALNRSDTCLCGQIVPRMVASPFYHPLHSQTHTLIVARLTRALSRLGCQLTEGDTYKLMRFAFFVVNFFISAALIVWFVIGIIMAQSQDEMIFRVTFLAPFVFYAVCELIAFRLKNQFFDRALAVANLCCAAMVGLVSASNLQLAIQKNRSDLLAWIVPIGVLAIAYLLACGILRLRIHSNKHG